jgi:hypothetical protein
MHRAYGREAYEAALATLTDAEREIITGPVLAASWYPIVTWMKFVDAMYKEVHARTGETVAQFDRRNLREAGSQTVKTVYSMFLGIMSAQRVLSKVPGFYSRLISDGKFDITRNDPGIAIITCTEGPIEALANVRRFYPAGAELMLEMNGARDVRTRVLKEVIRDGKFDLEIEITYRS